MTDELSPQIELAGMVLVIFSGETDIRWLRFLKSGFKHCFACVPIGLQWIVYDPLSNKTELTILSDVDSIDLEFWFRKHGCTVVRSRFLVTPMTSKLQPSLFTCVEAVKRLLGLKKKFIQTPWQLYRHLVPQTFTKSIQFRGSKESKLC